MNFREMIGLGVAGNFTGHLEQAGESADFVGLKIEDEEAPKGMFPFYLPSHPSSFLSTYPLSSDTIKPPKNEQIQIEPEVALVCDIEYGDDGKVTALKPVSFGAFNDCSIRKPNAKKISEKKNWGENSKGATDRFLPIDSFDEGGILDSYKIASFLKRGGELYEYGLDSEISGYSYFHSKLLSWMKEKMNGQIDEGPLEQISKLLSECSRPKQALISIGATRYTEYGETTYLKEGDELFVVLYPKAEYTLDEIKDAAISGALEFDDVSVLKQNVESGKN